MFMRKMRESAKWVMFILALAFIGWLVLDWVQSRGNLGGQINPVIGAVEGREIRYNDWNAYLQGQLELERQQQGTMTEEDVRVATEAAWEGLVNEVLLETEMRRLGIGVTDEEIRQAFLNQPPPEFIDYPAFQTDGQFDIQKYRTFFTDPSTDEATLLRIEAYYRRLLPQAKLQAVLSEGIYVTDAEAWRFYRDVNERATVRFVSVDPAQLVPADEVQITAQEVRAFYDAHRDDFQRPRTARANLISIPFRPSQADSVAARQRAETLRQRIVEGGEAFGDVARSESGDSLSAPNGGEIGRQARANINPVLADALYEIAVGEVSEPVETPFGFHLLRVDERDADSVTARQIFIPIEMTGQSEDSLFSLIDDIEDLALRSDLRTAADSMGVALRTDVVLTDGSDFVAGAGALGVARDWALDSDTPVGEVSEFFENAAGYHIFELLDRQPEGTLPLESVEASIRAELLTDKQRERARERVNEALTGAASLDAVAAALGTTVQESGPFRRTDFVPGLGQGTEAIGAAFGATPGLVRSALGAGQSIAAIEIVSRVEASREEFEAAREAIKQQLQFDRATRYTQRWIRALRDEASVRDNRELLRQQQQQAAASGF